MKLLIYSSLMSYNPVSFSLLTMIIVDYVLYC